MARPPDLSIVITNYNYAAFVGEAIDSALAQRTPADVEVIVVDDGSTDTSVEVIQRYGDAVQLIRQANGGQGAAFNAGFAASGGGVVMFLDADDTLDHDAAARLLDRFGAQPGVGKVVFRLREVDGAGAVLGTSTPPAAMPLPAGDLRARVLSTPDDIPWPPTSGNAFRRSVLDAILPMPGGPYRVCADFYLSNLSALHGDVAALAQPAAAYRVHGANSYRRDAVSLADLRRTIERTEQTHASLAAAARSLGLGPARLASVSDTVNRMVSLRMEPAAHPVAADTRRSLLRGGLRALRRRQDLVLWRRVAGAPWLVALAVAPRPAMVRLARPIVKLAPGDR